MAYNGSMPFPYTTRVSNRAKRLQIRISPAGEIEVVVPRQFDISQAPLFVKQQEAWIARTLQRINRHPAPSLQPIVLPTRVELVALNESWQIGYSDHPRSRHVVKVGSAASIQLVAPNQRGHHAALVNWLHQHAKERLSPWLLSISRELRLPFSQIAIRAQKRRWGSCSAEGRININRNLLFLKPELVRYLFVHELCHTVHLNHSRHFWQLVEQHEPNFRPLHRSLRKAMQEVPRWAQPHATL